MCINYITGKNDKKVFRAFFVAKLIRKFLENVLAPACFEALGLALRLSTFCVLPCDHCAANQVRTHLGHVLTVLSFVHSRRVVALYTEFSDSASSSDAAIFVFRLSRFNFA